MSWAAVAQAVRPTARAMACGPLLGVVTALVVTAGTARLLVDGPGPGPLPMLAAALLAAVTLEALHDPAGRLLAAVPLAAFARGLIRIALTATPAIVVLLVLSTILPDHPTPLLVPGLALDSGPLAWWHTAPVAVSAVALGLVLLAGRR